MANRGNKKDLSDVMKLILMTAIGLFVAIVGYPLLHELGHSLAAVLLGGKVLDFQLLPLPNILCDSTGLSTLFISIIGLSGMALPFLVSVCIRTKGYYLWFAGLIRKDYDRVHGPCISQTIRFGNRCCGLRSAASPTRSGLSCGYIHPGVFPEN